MDGINCQVNGLPNRSLIQNGLPEPFSEANGIGVELNVIESLMGHGSSNKHAIHLRKVRMERGLPEPK